MAGYDQTAVYTEPAPAELEDVIGLALNAFTEADDDLVFVTLSNITTMKTDYLLSVFELAVEMGIEAVVRVNSVVMALNGDGGEEPQIIASMFITAEAAALLPKNADMSISIFNDDILEVYQTLDKLFYNNTAVISFGHEGEFGAYIHAAVMLNLIYLGIDLSDADALEYDEDGLLMLDDHELFFYSFCMEELEYELIETEWAVDALGLLHFTTPAGAYLVITNAPLAHR
jgi:hypothetical protein